MPSPASAKNLEHEIKAVFIYNFINFTTWPPFKAQTTTTICVSGAPDIAQTLQIIREKEQGKPNSAPFRVRSPGILEDSSACHIWFLGQSLGSQIHSVLARQQRSGILYISDMPDFARAGGMVGMIRDQTKLKLQMNAAALRRSQLHISPRLLALAEMI